MDALMSSPEETLPTIDSSSKDTAEKERATRKSQKRRTISSRYKVSASKRRRTFKSRKKESAEDRKRAIPSLDSSNPKHAHDSVIDTISDSMQKTRSSIKGSFPEETRTPTNGGIIQQDNAGHHDSLVHAFQSLKVLESGHRSAAGSNKDARVLRPRQSLSREALLKEDPPARESAAIIGRRIKVFWPLDKKWYKGHVATYETDKGYHVLYDDGDEEWLFLSKEKYKLEPEIDTGEADLPAQALRESSVREPNKKKRRKFRKDGSIGDDVLLSAVVSKHRLEGVLRKGACNGPIDTGTSPGRIDQSISECVVPYAANASKHARKKGRKPIHMQTVTDGLPNLSSNLDEKTQEGQAKDAKNFTEESLLKSVRRRGVLDATKRGQASRVYVRRRRKFVKIRGLSDSDGGENSRKDKKLNLDSVEQSSTVDLMSKDEALLRGQSQQKLPRKRNRRSLKRVADGSFIAQGVQTNTTGDWEIANVLQSKNNQPSKQKRKKKLACTKIYNLEESQGKSSQSFQLCESEPIVTIKLGAVGHVSWIDGEAMEKQRFEHCDDLTQTLDNEAVSLSTRSEALGALSYNRMPKIMGQPKVDNAGNCLIESMCANIQSGTDLDGMDFQQGCHMMSAAYSMAPMNSQLPSAQEHASWLSVKAGPHVQAQLAHNFTSSECAETVQQEEASISALPSTLHLVQPRVVISLFTWHLSNILRSVGFMHSTSFRERLYLNASVQDLIAMLRLMYTVIRVVPCSEWADKRCPSHWQARILFDVWSVLSGPYEWCTHLKNCIPAGIEVVLMKHLRQLIDECKFSGFFTCQQVLNVLVYYFLKPYIATTLCEQGALLSVIIQRFLILERSTISSNLERIPCICQAMEQIKMRLDTNSFAIYLNRFPALEDWCSRRGLFQDQMRAWIASLSVFNYAKEFMPVPSVELSSGSDLQVTTAMVVPKGCFPVTSGAFHLDQTCGYLVTYVRSFKEFLRIGAADAFPGHTDLFSCLIALSMLQKSLILGCKSPSFNTKGIAIHVNESRSTLLESNAYHEKLEKDTSEWFDKDTGKELMLLGVDFLEDGAPSKRAKIEVDEFMQERASPFIQLKLGNFVKEEGIVDSFDWVIDRDINDVASCPLIKDAYLSVGSPSVSSLESNMLGYSQSSKLTGRVLEHNGDTTGVESKMTSYYSRPLVDRKQKRKNKRPSIWRDTRKPSKQPQVLPNDLEKPADEQVPSYCLANLLITKGDIGWREAGAKVELQLDGGEYLIAAQNPEGKVYKHKVQDDPFTSHTNRYTHAVMWNGGNGWSLEFNERKQWNTFKRLFEECGHMNARAASVKQIPIPGVRLIDESQDTDDLLGLPTHWSPASFISHTEGQVEYALRWNHILYDMASDDEAFVSELNGKQAASWNVITDEAFERILYEFEKITYLRLGEMVQIEEVIELCQGLGPEAVLRAIHDHWWKKRLNKGTALVRHFQPPLWERYQKEVESWKAKLSELQLTQLHRSKEQLEAVCPRPLMFAFCLPSRGLDLHNSSRKIQKQRSQRKLGSAFKSSRTSSLETSEESLMMSGIRPPRLHLQMASTSLDPDWHPSPKSRLPIASQYQLAGRSRSYDHAFSGYVPEAGSSKAEEAQAKATEARRVAAVKAAKSRVQFMKFDFLFQRAVAAFIELEAIQSTELFSAGEEDEACSSSAPSEQLLVLKDRVDLLSGQYSGFVERSSELNRYGAGTGSVGGADIMCQIRKPEFQESTVDSDALLPASGSGHADTWMGTTLIQRAD